MLLFKRDKIENSIVISHNEIKKKYLPLSTPRQRLISLITYILMSLYTIYTCIILKFEAHEISLCVIANIISLISMITIKAISKSIYELNHQNTYLVIDFINKLAKLVLFYYAISKFLDVYEDLKLDRIMDLLVMVVDSIKNKEPLLTVLTSVSDSGVLTAVSLLVSVLTFIPIVIYFLIINIKMVCTVIIWITPGVNVITYLFWLFKRHDIFKVYTKVNDEMVQCETRKINIKGYNLSMFFTKLAISFIVIVFAFTVITLGLNISVIELVKNFYKFLYELILDILGFLTGYGR